MPCLILLVVELCNTTECKCMRVLGPPQYTIKESVHQHLNFKHHTKTISTNPGYLQSTMTKLVLVEFVNKKHNTRLLQYFYTVERLKIVLPQTHSRLRKVSPIYGEMVHPTEQHAMPHEFYPGLFHIKAVPDHTVSVAYVPSIQESGIGTTGWDVLLWWSISAWPKPELT